MVGWKKLDNEMLYIFAKDLEERLKNAKGELIKDILNVRNEPKIMEISAEHLENEFIEVKGKVLSEWIEEMKKEETLIN